MGDARVDKRADGAPPAPAPAPARDPATNGNVHPGAALDRADGQGGADVIDHVQRTAGNQAATALVAQRAVHGGRGVEGVVDDLQLAMRMTVEGGGFVYTKVDVEAVASALTGLTAAEAAAVRALYEKRTELNLIDVLRGHGGLAAWGLSPEQRARLLALAQGTSAALDTAAMQQGPLAAATAVIGYAAEAMTAEARGVEADAIVVHDALQELEKRKMAEMFVGKAQATEGKGWETLLQTLSKAPDHNGRVAVVYEERYDTNLLTKFHEVFSGVGLDRVLAVYRGDRATAASAAVLQSLDKAEGMRAGLENPMAKVASMTSPGGKEDYEAAARRQREVEGAIEANMAELVQADPAAAKRLLARKDVAEKMQAWVRPETTAVVAELVESDDVAVAAARLVRSEREHTITGADIEQSLMSLRQLAFNEVHTWFVTTASHLRASLSDAQLEAAVKALARQRGEVFAGVLRKVFARFEKRFDSASERPLAKVLGSVGSEADRDRSRWLWVGGGQIGDEVHTFFGRTWTVSADVRTVDLAIRSKDIERIRQVLEPKGPKQMDDLTKRYKDELDRDLHADLLGPPELRAYAQAMSIWLKPAEREKADEQRALVKGVGFEPTTEDPLGLVREEASWTYNRLTVLHDRVMGNRGTFARLHDWVGNLEHDLVERALDDGTEAYNLALAATGIFGMANLAMAQQHLGTLRRARARLEHNLDVYKTATAEAFNAFVDFAVMAVVTIVTFGEGTAVAMAFRGIAGTIGTKLVLKGDDYSLTEFKNDLLGGAGGAMFGALGSKAFEVLGPRIAGLASEAGLVLPRELATIAKKGAGFVVDTEASTLGTSAFTGDAHFASADDFKMGVVTKAAHTAMGAAKPNASAHGEQPPETTTRPPGGGGEGESATRPPGGGGGEGESAPRRPEPEGSQADHATDTVSGGGGTAPPEAAPAPRSERRLPNAAHPEEVRTFLREAAAAGDHEAILRLWYERGTWAEGTRWLAKAAGPESAHLQSARQLIFDEALAHVRSRLPDVEASLPGSVGAGSDMDPTFMGPHTLEAVRLFREGFERALRQRGLPVEGWMDVFGVNPYTDPQTARFAIEGDSPAAVDARERLTDQEHAELQVQVRDRLLASGPDGHARWERYNADQRAEVLRIGGEEAAARFDADLARTEATAHELDAELWQQASLRPELAQHGQEAMLRHLHSPDGAALRRVLRSELLAKHQEVLGALHAKAGDAPDVATRAEILAETMRMKSYEEEAYHPAAIESVVRGQQAGHQVPLESGQAPKPLSAMTVPERLNALVDSANMLEDHLAHVQHALENGVAPNAAVGPAAKYLARCLVEAHELGIDIGQYKMIGDVARRLRARLGPELGAGGDPAKRGGATMSEAEAELIVREALVGGDRGDARGKAPLAVDKSGNVDAAEFMSEAQDLVGRLRTSAAIRRADPETAAAMVKGPGERRASGDRWSSQTREASQPTSDPVTPAEQQAARDRRQAELEGRKPGGPSGGGGPPGGPAGGGGAPPVAAGPAPKPSTQWNDAPDLGDLGVRPKLASAGHGGSIQSRGKYAGVYEVILSDGTRAVAKLYHDSPKWRTSLVPELEGAYGAYLAGGGKVHGLVRASMEGQLLVGLAMDMAPGGFVSAVRPERPPGFEFMTPEQQHAIELANEAAYQSALPEAARWRAAVGERTVESLDTYGDGLLKNGYANIGELQFFVDGSGKIRPIDFTGIKPLPEDHTSPEAVDMIEQHMEHFDSARKHLLEIVEENKRAGRP